MQTKEFGHEQTAKIRHTKKRTPDTIKQLAIRGNPIPLSHRNYQSLNPSPVVTKHQIYKAKTAAARAKRPAPEAAILPAPESAAAEAEAEAEELAELLSEPEVAEGELLSEPEADGLLALPVPVAEDAALEALEAAAAAEVAAAEPLEKKYWFLHLVWQSAYAWVSASVPLPCLHLAEHSVVALTMSSFGAGLPKQVAWQTLSLALHVSRQACWVLV